MEFFGWEKKAGSCPNSPIRSSISSTIVQAGKHWRAAMLSWEEFA
jgi:hypothetical protein